MAGGKVLACMLALVSCAYAGDRTLVLLDNWAVRETHSTFFKSLKGNTHRWFHIIAHQPPGQSSNFFKILFVLFNIICIIMFP